MIHTGTRSTASHLHARRKSDFRLTGSDDCVIRIGLSSIITKVRGRCMTACLLQGEVLLSSGTFVPLNIWNQTPIVQGAPRCDYLAWQTWGKSADTKIIVR